MPKINATIAKILHAQSSMTAAKLLSARLPLPRLLRYSRIGEGAPAGPETESEPSFIGEAGSVFGTGNTDPGSFSVVIRLKGTILFPVILTLGLIVSGLTAVDGENK